jgi:hypothetical protein
MGAHPLPQGCRGSISPSSCYPNSFLRRKSRLFLRKAEGARRRAEGKRRRAEGKKDEVRRAATAGTVPDGQPGAGTGSSGHGVPCPHRAANGPPRRVDVSPGAQQGPHGRVPPSNSFDGASALRGRLANDHAQASRRCSGLACAWHPVQWRLATERPPIRLCFLARRVCAAAGCPTQAAATAGHGAPCPYRMANGPARRGPTGNSATQQPNNRRPAVCSPVLLSTALLL